MNLFDLILNKKTVPTPKEDFLSGFTPTPVFTGKTTSERIQSGEIPSTQIAPKNMPSNFGKQIDINKTGGIGGQLLRKASKVPSTFDPNSIIQPITVPFKAGKQKTDAIATSLGNMAYDYANTEEDVIQKFLDDSSIDTQKKRGLLQALNDGEDETSVRDYLKQKYYPDAQFQEVAPMAKPLFPATGKENALVGSAKMIGNIPTSLYNLGAGAVNIGATALEEGVGPTAGMLSRGIIKGVGQGAESVSQAYREGGALGATSKVIEGTQKAIINDPALIFAPQMVKGAGTLATKGGKTIVGGVEKVAPKVVQGARVATDIVTAPVKSIVNTARKYVATPEEISGIQSAIKPKQRVKNGVVQRSQEAIDKEISLTNSLIRQSGVKPTDLATYKTAIKSEMEKIGSEINRLTGQDLTIDITPSTAKLRQLANSDIVKTLDPADTNALLGLADRLDANGGKMKVSMAEEMNQWLNSVLKDTTVPKSEAYKRGLMTLVEDIRNGLDDSISNIPGQFKEIKKAYGALRNVYGDTVAREIVFNRQNMGGLVDSIGAIEGAGSIVSGGGKMLMGDLKGGVADIGRGIASNAVGRFIKSKNDPNNIIRAIFEKGGKKSTLPNIPNKPTNGNIPRNSTNPSLVLDMGTAKKAEGKVKPKVVKPKVVKPPQVKPVEKTNLSKNAKQQVSNANASDTVPEGYFRNIFGEIQPLPSNKKGGFIRLPFTSKLNVKPQPKQLFAGENAKAPPKGKTGWFKGADGKMRFEIDDSVAKINIGNEDITKLGKILSHDELFKQYPELKNLDVELNKNIKGAGIYSNNLIRLNTDTVGGLLAQKNKQWQQALSYKPTESDIKMLMSDGISKEKATELFKNIQNKRAIKIEKEIEDIKSKGYIDDADIKSTLLHEIQHYIQMKEGFARGSDPILENKIIAKEVQKKIDAVNEKMMKNKEGMDSMSNSEFEQMKIRHKELEAQRSELEDKMDRLRKYESEGFDQYNRSAGEVEARNVQSRMNLTAKERTIKSPESTEDVPRAKQIIRMDSKGPSMLIKPKPLSPQKTIKPLTEGKQSATMGDMETKKLIEEARKYKSAEEFEKNFKKIYHQTGLDNSKNIEINGFDINKKGVGFNDPLPSGVNTKNTNKELKLGSGEQVQMELFIDKNKIKDLQFTNRAEAENYLYKNSQEYRKYIDESEKINKEYNDKYGEYIWARPDGEKLLGEWKNKLDSILVKAKSASTNYFKSKGYNAIYIENDVGGLGKGTTENYIILDPSIIKTKSQLKKIYEQSKK